MASKFFNNPSNIFMLIAIVCGLIGMGFAIAGVVTTVSLGLANFTSVLLALNTLLLNKDV